MGRKCSVDSCSSDSNRAEDTGVTFHKVPLHPDLRPKWLSLCRIPEDKMKVKIIYVCSRHFLRADFCNFKGKKYMLRQGVLPSVFPWDKSKLDAIKADVGVKNEPPPPKKQKKVKTETPVKEELVDLPVEVKIEPEEAKMEVKVEEELKEEPGEEIKDFDEQLKMAQTSTGSEAPNPGQMNFSINSRIEVLDNNNLWYPAKINEVDYEENEVLIHFEKFSSKYDEWIPMNSARLRPIQTKPVQKYEVGERCMASWSDSRKFPATITKTLENDTYEVLFDDGFVKILRQHRLSKMQAGKPSQASPLFDPIKSTKQERRDKKRKLNVAALFRKKPRLSLSDDKKLKEVVPEQCFSPEPTVPVEEPNTWHPKWENGRPVGIESAIETTDGLRKSIIVPDPRLPDGWVKHLCQRLHGSSAGKWDTIIKSPDNRRFRSRTEIKNYLSSHPDLDVDFDSFDFSIYRNSRRRTGGVTKPKAEEVQEEPPPPPEEQQQDEAEAATEEQSVFNLKIVFEDDAYKCPIEGCGKNFRRENLALMHVKHYHPEYSKYLESTPNVADLAYARTVGESLDGANNLFPKSSPGPAVKPATIKTLAPNIKPVPSDVPDEAPPKKDTELIKILNQALGDEKAQPEAPPGSPYPDIKLKDLLTKPSDIPNRDEATFKSIKTLLPKSPAAIETTNVPEQPPQTQTQPSIGEGDPELINQDPIETQQQSFDGIIIEGGKIIKLERMKQEEIINCTCGFAEEDGLMIQCELCLCWQHAYCNNIQRETEVPEKYVCYICQNPSRERRSMKYVHDQEWLKQGVLPSGSYHTKDTEEMQKRFDKLKRSHDISGGLLELKEYAHSVSLKLMIAGAKNHPKLYLWSKPWDKPKLPERTEVKPEDATETKPKLENGDHQYIKNELDMDKQDLPNESMLMMILKGGKEDIPLLNQHQNAAPIIPRPEAAIDLDDCRLNLLDHISHSQSLIEERLDDFEKQMDALEEDEDVGDGAKTVQTIQMLLRDLEKLKRFSQVPMV